MLLYLHSAPVRLLLMNTIGQRAILSSATPFWQTVLLQNCSSAAPKPTLDASVSK